MEQMVDHTCMYMHDPDMDIVPLQSISFYLLLNSEICLLNFTPVFQVNGLGQEPHKWC
jgi:hypothetical protein